jgi:sensor histidine kinase YesM
MTLLRGSVDFYIFFFREQIRLDDRFKTLVTAGLLKGHYYTDKGPFRKLKYGDSITWHWTLRRGFGGEYLFAQLFFSLLLLLLLLLLLSADDERYKIYGEQKKIHSV